VLIVQGKRPGGRSTLGGANTADLEEEVKKHWSQLQDLQNELIKKDQKLQTKTQTLKELKTTLQTERDDFETALRGKTFCRQGIFICLFYTVIFMLKSSE